MLKPFGKTCLYRKDCLQGKVFEGKEAITAALGDGWCEAPYLVMAEPVPPVDDKQFWTPPKRGRRIKEY